MANDDKNKLLITMNTQSTLLLRYWVAALTCVVSFTFLVVPARATLQFSDSFSYSTGALNGDGPPAGSPSGQTAWTTSSGAPQVASPGLSFSGVRSAGNTTTITGVAGNNGDIATASMTAVPGGSGTEWVGFLISEQSGGSTPNGYAVVVVGSNGPSFGLIFNQNLYGLDNNTGSQADTRVSTTAPSASTTWMVAELNFSTGMEYLFLNPSTANPPSTASAAANYTMTSAFQSSGFSAITLAAGFNTAQFKFDEVRVGTTFADVVPEPSAASFLAMAFTGLCARRFRTRKKARV